MISSLCFVSLFAWAATSATDEPRPEAPKLEVVRQAQPVVAWLTAVKTSDVKLLKTVWSTRMTEGIPQDGEDEHWNNRLEAYKKVWAQQFGEYEVSDFTFTFAGNDTAGVVVIEHNGRKLPGLRVIKEGDQWKIDER
jgi:hypothetical protein